MLSFSACSLSHWALSSLHGHVRRSCPLFTTDGSASRVSPATRTYPLLGSVSAPLYMHVDTKNVVEENDMMMKLCDVCCEDDNGIDAMMAIENVPEDDVGQEGSRNYESCSDKHPPVRGRLKACVDFWATELLASPFVVDTIQNGYPLPLASIPPMYKGDNHALAVENSVFVDKALTELLADGGVVPMSFRPHVCSPLMVVLNDSGKKR